MFITSVRAVCCSQYGRYCLEELEKSASGGHMYVLHACNDACVHLAKVVTPPSEQQADRRGGGDMLIAERHLHDRVGTEAAVWSWLCLTDPSAILPQAHKLLRWPALVALGATRGGPRASSTVSLRAIAAPQGSAFAMSPRPQVRWQSHSGSAARRARCSTSLPTVALPHERGRVILHSVRRCVGSADTRT